MEGRADAVLDERARQAAGDRVGGLLPVQWAGTITSGASCSSARTVLAMTGSNSLSGKRAKAIPLKRLWAVLVSI